jgi:hypothetical protein
LTTIEPMKPLPPVTKTRMARFLAGFSAPVKPVWLARIEQPRARDGGSGVDDAA